MGQFMLMFHQEMSFENVFHSIAPGLSLFIIYLPTAFRRTCLNVTNGMQCYANSM